MIKVGDYVQVKPSVNKILVEHFITKYGKKMALVKKILPCRHKGTALSCDECPGYINESGECYGYTNGDGYILEPVAKDWDE